MRPIAPLLLVMLLLPSLPMQALAQSGAAIATTQLPTGGKVVGGQATLQSNGNTLNVNQTTSRGVVEWNSFNVGSQANVNFNQPSANAVTLSRVMDMNASQILGRISATGQVFISNPNGVIFGSTAQVDVGGLVATTQNISNADFMNGKATFEGNGQAGSVINQGTLQAALGGYIALLAPQVRNEGVIVAREGTVALSAGDKTSLEFSGAKLVSVIIDRPVIDALVENKQLIRAEGGFVVMSARSANALMNSVIKQTGTIEAPSLVHRGGRILLEGGERGVVSAGGVLNVSGTQAGTTGGRIVVTGDKVAVTENALLDATGQTGGGQINIGGGWQGQDPTIRQANATRVEAGARLDASAIQSGNGGEVVVWSDIQKAGGMTHVAGDLKARGGATQGDGGRIETSGHWLSTQGATGDANAPNGTAGQWLFDPYNVTITSTATQNNAASSGTWTPSGSTSEIKNTDITALLNAGTSVTVTTGSTGSDAGNITVDAAITQSATAPATRLTLTANQDIAINSAITMSKSGSKLELNAGNATSGGNIALTGAVTADTLNMNLTGAGAVTQTAAVSANNLRISGTSTQVTLANASNNIGVVAANVASLNLTTENGIDLGSSYGKGLYVGTVEGMSGVTATGDVSLVSRNSHIVVEQNISSASTANTAVQLNAGEALSTGAYTGTDSATNPHGANVILSTGKTITPGSGGRATIYSGSSSGSGANLATYIGAGSGRFRYNSDELVTNYTAPLSSGLYAIYRHNPTLTVAANNTTMEYGDALNPTTSTRVSGYMNGDTLAQAVSTGASVAIGGTRSGANYYIAGSHALTASGAAGTLGYGFSYTDGTLTVTPKALTISATASNKVYDASAAATSSLTSNQLQNDVLTLNNTSSTFNNKNAGNGKTVTVSGLSVTGNDAANYTLANISATTTANVTAKALTATFTASNKVYDGSTAATVAGTSTDIIAGDTVTFTKTSSTFANKNVGTGKTVSVAGVQLAGTDAGNYALANTTATATADITAKSLTAAFTASNKEYDGNTTATVSASSAHIVSGDTVSIANTGATFSDKNAGTGKTVSVAGISISGSDAGNYSLANVTASTTANISTKALTISGITAADKTYDALTTATVNVAGAVKTGLVAGDAVNVAATGTFNNKNVGSNKAVALTSTYSGADAGNYNISSQAQTTASITPRILAVNATANDKTYDTTRTATYTLNSDKVAGDALTLSASTALFDTKNAAAGKTVTVGGITVTGTDAGNYTLQNASTTTTAEIRKADLNITGITANAKTYDSTVAASLSGTAAIAPLQGDTVTLGGAASSTFADKNVGSAKPVTTTGYNITGTDAGNYNLVTPTLSADITPKALTISGITAANKVYDGSATATVSTAGVTNAVLVSGGMIAADNVTVAATGTFRNAANTADDKNAGNAKIVQLTSTYGGSDATNYTITGQATTTASITKQDVTLTAITADSKTYNATTAANISAGTVNGTVASEALLISGTGTFDTANAGTGKTVTVADVTALTKTNSTGDWNNYNLTTTGPITTTANIDKKNVTLTAITADSKTYNASNAATISAGTLDGTVASEALLISGTGTFSDANAATSKTVTVADVTALTKTNSTGNWSNYNLTTSGAMTTTANINKKDVALTAITADNKTYDATNAATVSAGTVTGMVGAETLLISGAGAFSDANAAAGKTVTVASTATLLKTNGSGLWDNYNLTTTGPITTTANIDKKNVTLTAITADSKTYNASNAATISAGTLAGTVASEALLISGTGTFSDANAATSKTITVADVTALTKTNSTGNWSNYNLTTSGAMTTTANINKKDVALTAITADNKTYDATNAATISAGALTGTVGSEALFISGTGTFSDANASSGKTVTVADVTALTKTNGSGLWNNYHLTTTGAMTTTANIDKKNVTLTGLTADNKLYNASTAAIISSGTLSGTVGSETLAISGSGTFDTINPGVAKTVTTPNVADLTKTNGTGNWNNYNLTNTGAMTTTATIVPVANPCVALNGCITTESAVIAKLSNEPVPSTLASTATVAQTVKPTTTVAQATPTPVAPPPVLLMQPISSASMVAKGLSPAQVAELPPAQLGPLIKSLDRSQLLAITEKQMNGLNVNQLDDLIGLLNRVANPAKP